VSGIRVVHITTAHAASDVRIYHKECRTLAGAGYEVVLIVPHEGAVPDGDVRVLPVPMPKDRRERMTATIWRCWRTATRTRGAVYHLHDPELLVVGLALKLAGRTVVYDAHEDLGRQILTKHWLPSVLRKPIALGATGVLWFAGWMLDAVVAATPLIASRYAARKTVTVQNFPIADELAAGESVPYTSRPSEIAYVGGLFAIRGVGEMIAAIHQVQRTVPGVSLVLAGSFSPPDLEDEVRRLPGWTTVRYLGWQSRAGVAAILGRARVGLALLHPEPNYIDSYPVKLFEYMAAGVPVVASDFPLWHGIVDGAGCGLLVDPLDVAAIGRAVRWLLDHPSEAEAMGERGRRAVVERYNWSGEGAKLLALYAVLTQP
jgi:glycosyltransferase involved in cell wall biosynthesis